MPANSRRRLTKRVHGVAYGYVSAEVDDHPLRHLFGDASATGASATPTRPAAAVADTASVPPPPSSAPHPGSVTAHTFQPGAARAPAVSTPVTAVAARARTPQSAPVPGYPRPASTPRGYAVSPSGRRPPPAPPSAAPDFSAPVCKHVPVPAWGCAAQWCQALGCELPSPHAPCDHTTRHPRPATRHRLPRPSSRGHL